MRSIIFTMVSVAGLLFVIALPAQAERLCHTTGDTQAFVTQSVCVSSQLQSQSGNNYGIRSLVDDNASTAWCEGGLGGGIGETITIRMEDAAPPKQIMIRNGYAKSNKSFRRNGRVKTLRVMAVSYDDVPQREFDVFLEDSSRYQPIDISWNFENPRLIELTITSIYPGSKYSDTCVSDLYMDYGF